MPFQSEKQRRYLHANHPEIAKRWERDYAGGGLIPAHQAGIYGLAEGGRTGFFTGAQADTASGKSMSPGTSASGGSRSGGEGGYQNVHQTGAVSQTPGRTTTPDKGDGNIKKGPQEGWTQDDVKKAIKEGERKKELRDLALQGEKTEKWEQAQKWTKPSTSSKIIGGLITLATMGVLGPGAAKAAKYYGYYNKAKQVKTALDTGKFKIANKEFNISNLTNKLTSSDRKLMESLPKGHPERIALEAQMKVRTPPKHDGEGGATTSIKIEDIETVNDANAEQVQLKKYQEMEWAAYLAQLEQQKLRAKQMAYWKQMMAPYMAAQGGRVPGYNTGGLSNLFRLKNVQEYKL